MQQDDDGICDRYKVRLSGVGLFRREAPSLAVGKNIASGLITRLGKDEVVRSALANSINFDDAGVVGFGDSSTIEMDILQESRRSPSPFNLNPFKRLSTFCVDDREAE
jgi:hypothetical protein